MDPNCADFPVYGAVEAHAHMHVPVRTAQNPHLGKMFDGVMQMPNRNYFGPRRSSARTCDLGGGHQEQPRSASYCGLHALIDLSY